MGDPGLDDGPLLAEVFGFTEERYGGPIPLEAVARAVGSIPRDTQYRCRARDGTEGAELDHRAPHGRGEVPPFRDGPFRGGGRPQGRIP